MKKITKTVQFIKKHFRGFIPIFFLVVTMISCKKDLNPISQTKEGLAQPSSIESECSTLNEVVPERV